MLVIRCTTEAPAQPSRSASTSVAERVSTSGPMTLESNVKMIVALPGPYFDHTMSPEPSRLAA